MIVGWGYSMQKALGFNGKQVLVRGELSRRQGIGAKSDGS
jgi:hypothetical protein